MCVSADAQRTYTRSTMASSSGHKSRAGAKAQGCGPEQTGELREHPTKSGIVTYSMRVRWRGERLSVRIGDELEGWNRPLAELKLAETVAAIAAGTWQPPAPELADEDAARPPRNHLEADEVLSLIQAADPVDQGVTPASLKNARLARQLRAEGKTWTQVGDAMGCSEATAIYRSRIRPKRDAPRRRRTMIVLLALSGTRAEEHTELVWERMDETHGRIVLDDAKTPSGIREIQLSACKARSATPIGRRRSRFTPR